MASNQQTFAETNQRALTSDVKSTIIHSNVVGVTSPGTPVGSGGGGATEEIIFPNVDFVAVYDASTGSSPGGGNGGNNPPASQIIMTLTAPTSFTGADLTDLNATINDLTADGLQAIAGGGTEYLGLRSTDPGGGGWHDFHTSGNPTTLLDGPTVSGFNIGILTTSDSANGLQFAGVSRATSINESFTIKVRVGGVPGQNSTWNNGARVMLRMSDGSTAFIAHAVNLDPTTNDANWIVHTFDSWINAAVTFVSKSHNAIQNWQEFVFTWKNLSGHPTMVEPGVAGSIDLIAPAQYSIAIHGIQVVGGVFDKAWISTGNVGQTIGINTNFNLGGTIDAMLKGTASSIIVEIGPHQENLIYPTGHIISHGVSQEDAIIDIDGMTSITGPSSNKAVVGSGGFLGICRVGLARDASGYSLSFNGGAIKHVATPLTFSNTIKLLRGKTGTIRKIEVWNTALSDQQLKAGTEILGRIFPQLPPNMLNWVNATQTFIDDFTTNTIRLRKSQFDPTVPPLNYNPSLGFFNLTNQYDTIGNWMPRLASFVNSAKGNGKDNINAEYQQYCDPQYPGNYNPFDWGVQTSSCLTITTIKTTSLPISQQNLIENRFVNGQDTGVKYPYVSGVINSWGKFEQKFGYFEARIRMPASADGSSASKIWPSFWFLPNDGGNRNEFDVVQLIGNGVLGNDSNSYHVNNYGINLGGQMAANHPYNLGDDFHTYGMLWTTSYIEMYRDGKMYSHYDIQFNHNTNDVPDYPIFDLAVGGASPGIPDATTDAALPAKMLIDYFRAFKLV